VRLASGELRIGVPGRKCGNVLTTDTLASMTKALVARRAFADLGLAPDTGT
jgi:hypothetical protein